MLNRAVSTPQLVPLARQRTSCTWWRNLNACGATQPGDRSESDEPTSPPICRSSPGSLTSLQSSHRILHSACVVSAGAPWRKFGCATMLLQGPQPCFLTSPVFLKISLCLPIPRPCRSPAPTSPNLPAAAAVSPALWLMPSR